MNPPNIGPHPEGPDESGVEARTETAGTGRGHEEIDLLRSHPPLLKAGLDRPASQLEASALESRVELVKGLVGGKGLPVKKQVTVLDPAPEEKTAAEGISISGPPQDLGLREPLSWCRGPHREDPGSRPLVTLHHPSTKHTRTPLRRKRLPMLAVFRQKCGRSRFREGRITREKDYWRRRVWKNSRLPAESGDASTRFCLASGGISTERKPSPVGSGARGPLFPR